ncbi:MAG: hypothetical protein HYZ69_01525 [Candidatus Colwellbacteria bacterium]|nr:hypothetical protein [Candidatus Colwellbacteria bacterium]
MAFDYPVIIKRPGVQEPKKAPVYYIIAANGQFLHKKLSWVEATIPVKRISILEDQKTEAHVLLPPIPRLILAKTVEFFRKVYAEYRSEAIILLHYNKETLCWDMSIPRQNVSASAISDYDKTQRIERYACMGTIHSHASMRAFHSGTDQRDEAECADGIHITIGDINLNNGFSMDVEAVVNGNRFGMEVEWCDGIEKHICEGYHCSMKHPFFAKEKLVNVKCEEIKNWEVPDEWMRRVSYSAPWRTITRTTYGSVFGRSPLPEEGESEHTLWKRTPVPTSISQDSSEEGKTPSLREKIKGLWEELTNEPYNNLLHTASCRCHKCKEYYQKKVRNANNAHLDTTRDGIRVITGDNQRETTHHALPKEFRKEGLVRKKDTEDKIISPEKGIQNGGKKTRKLSLVSQMILRAAPEAHEIPKKETTKGETPRI